MTNSNVKPFMSLGLFVFEATTLPYQTHEHAASYEWSKKQIIGKGPQYQPLGRGEQTRSLSGELVEGITGGHKELDKLRDMMHRGRSWNLTTGEGEDLGAWFISSVRETGEYFKPGGGARVTQFSLELTLDLDLEALGNLEDSE